MTYSIVLTREEDGRYSVEVPALAGCFTWGRNVAHAVQMAEAAIRLYVESLRGRGQPVPSDRPSVSVDMSATAEALVFRLEPAEDAEPVGA